MSATLETNLEDFDPEHLEQLREEPSPLFLKQTRAAVRGRHARAQRLLGWFDLEAPIGTIRFVHDGVLVHLATNAPDEFDEFANRQLGFEPPYEASERVSDDVQAVLAGHGRGDSIAFLDSLPQFQRAVLQATARIPRGEIRPYGWVAREAGSPGAVRAAGTALGHNPVPFIVPCHRVVRSDWSLGQYSAAGGPATKARVLTWEGCDLEQLAANHPAVVAVRGSSSFCFPVCGSLRGVDQDDLVPFRRAEDAVAQGLTPCEECRPWPIAV